MKRFKKRRRNRGADHVAGKSRRVKWKGIDNKTLFGQTASDERPERDMRAREGVGVAAQGWFRADGRGRGAGGSRLTR